MNRAVTIPVTMPVSAPWRRNPLPDLNQRRLVTAVGWLWPHMREVGGSSPSSPIMRASTPPAFCFAG
jgi:hypothetical protein